MFAAMEVDNLLPLNCSQMMVILDFDDLFWCLSSFFIFTSDTSLISSSSS
jgi:hypothetical protein